MPMPCFTAVRIASSELTRKNGASPCARACGVSNSQLISGKGGALPVS